MEYRYVIKVRDGKVAPARWWNAEHEARELFKEAVVKSLRLKQVSLTESMLVFLMKLWSGQLGDVIDEKWSMPDEVVFEVQKLEYSPTGATIKVK